MIHLPDPGLDQHAHQCLRRYQQEVDSAAKYADRVARGKELFSRYNTAKNRAFKQVRNSLTRLCSGEQRCAYCEDSVGDEVEHIQPKDLYPCLVFAWSNFVYACGRCNGFKNNKFAVVNAGRLVDVTRKRGSPVTPPLTGRPAFLDPRVEDPIDYLELDLVGTFFVIPRIGLTQIESEMAEFTVNVLKLNRDVLCRARATAFQAYLGLLHRYVDLRATGSTQQLSEVEGALKSMPHPTVWEEMKRRHSSIRALVGLFADAPECLDW